MGQGKMRPGPIAGRQPPPVPCGASLAAAVHALPAEERTVLFELALRRASVAEVAGRLGLPPDRVRRLAHDALGTLAKSLGPRPSAPRGHLRGDRQLREYAAERQTGDGKDDGLAEDCDVAPDQVVGGHWKSTR